MRLDCVVATATGIVGHGQGVLVATMDPPPRVSAIGNVVVEQDILFTTIESVLPSLWHFFLSISLDVMISAANPHRARAGSKSQTE